MPPSGTHRVGARLAGRSGDPATEDSDDPVASQLPGATDAPTAEDEKEEETEAQDAGE